MVYSVDNNLLCPDGGGLVAIHMLALFFLIAYLFTCYSLVDFTNINLLATLFCFDFRTRRRPHLVFRAGLFRLDCYPSSQPCEGVVVGVGVGVGVDVDAGVGVDVCVRVGVG